LNTASGTLTFGHNQTPFINFASRSGAFFPVTAVFANLRRAAVYLATFARAATTRTAGVRVTMSDQNIIAAIRAAALKFIPNRITGAVFAGIISFIVATARAATANIYCFSAFSSIKNTASSTKNRKKCQ